MNIRVLRIIAGAAIATYRHENETERIQREGEMPMHDMRYAIEQIADHLPQAEGAFRVAAQIAQKALEELP